MHCNMVVVTGSLATATVNYCQQRLQAFLISGLAQQRRACLTSIR